MEQHFYHFLKPISQEFSHTLKELEHAIYSSPRSMLTHSRTFIEALLQKVMIHENLDRTTGFTIMERIQKLDEHDLLTDDVHNALHEVRKLGNRASHDTRPFRFSESLTAWEYIYTIVKWFVEVYGSYKIDVPTYVDPIMKREQAYGLEEMTIRFQQIENLLKESLKKEQPKQTAIEKRLPQQQVEANNQTVTKNLSEQTDSLTKTMEIAPGFVSVRTITYGDDTVNVPYFLRDAFLLPQRFELSERFLVRLGGEEQARLMSELPHSLKGFHNRVTRYNESHSQTFFNELKQFIAEEIRRRKLIEQRPGELFLFFYTDEIVVTEDLGMLEINKINFTGMPSLIDQLNEDGINFVRDLPKELLILGKYKGVGKGRVESFFNQLKDIQTTMIKNDE